MSPSQRFPNIFIVIENQPGVTEDLPSDVQIASFTLSKTLIKII